MVETRSPGNHGDPNVAAFLTWLVPGSGHLYLGRTRTAVCLFLALEGLYALGLWLSAGRTFEFLDPELRGPLSTLLTPEAGNLGAMLFHLKRFGFGLEEPLPFPRTMVLGGFLSSLSGVANLFAAAHAHLCARREASVGPRASPVPAAFASALFPGLGHWLQGRRLRGAIVCGLLLGLFVTGSLLAEGSNLSRERHFYYWSGQFLLGAPAWILEAVRGRVRVTQEIPWADVGLLYGCMAGLLNVLAMLDVWGVAEKRMLEPEASPGSAAAPGGAS